MSAAVSAIDIQDVSVSYGTRRILDSINLRAGSGMIFGLIGLNGAGKTTLIRSMLGLRRSDSGVIRFFDRDAGHSEAKHHVAYLPEHFDPPSFLTGHEFLKFTCRLYNLSYRQEQGREHAVRLDLDPDALARRMGTYSKGMRQKLGLISNILSNARLQILDEPMSGLDPRARALVKNELKTMKNEGRTVFFSSHILSDMEEICDRVAILHQGRFVFEGTAADMLKTGGNNNPEKAFLAIIDRLSAI